MMVYNFKDCHVYTYQFKSYNSNHKLRTLRLNNHINDIPKNQNQVYQLLFNKIKLITLASYTASTMYDTIQLKDGLNNNRIANAGFVGEYIDKNNKFSLTIPPGIYYIAILNNFSSIAFIQSISYWSHLMYL